MKNLFNPSNYENWKHITKAISDFLRTNPNTSNPMKLMHAIANSYGFENVPAFKQGVENNDLSDKVKQKYIDQAGDSFAKLMFTHQVLAYAKDLPHLTWLLDDKEIMGSVETAYEARKQVILEETFKLWNFAEENEIDDLFDTANHVLNINQIVFDRMLLLSKENNVFKNSFLATIVNPKWQIENEKLSDVILAYLDNSVDNDEEEFVVGRFIELDENVPLMFAAMLPELHYSDLVEILLSSEFEYDEVTEWWSESPLNERENHKHNPTAINFAYIASLLGNNCTLSFQDLNYTGEVKGTLNRSLFENYQYLHESSFQDMALFTPTECVFSYFAMIEGHSVYDNGCILCGKNSDSKAYENCETSVDHSTNTTVIYFAVDTSKSKFIKQNLNLGNN